MENSLDDLFSYTSPAQLRKSVLEVFFTWIIEEPVLPQNYKETCRDFYMLVEMLNREEEARR